MFHRPAQQPFLKAIAWQRRDIDHLTPEQELSLYERNWRHRGVLAEPTREELQYIRELARHYRSDLACDV